MVCIGAWNIWAQDSRHLLPVYLVVRLMFIVIDHQMVPSKTFSFAKKYAMILLCQLHQWITDVLMAI
jgi:hypothetical protein